MTIKKAIFPVAGLGTRFLPATKANPKEMLPIVDKPLIQYAVEEAVNAGIDQLIFVTSYSKRSIEDHFDSNFELECTLEKKGKHDLLAMVKNILPAHVSCVYVRQKEPLGLGHAVLCAKRLINNEPCAVLLADDLIDGHVKSCLQQMMDVYQQTKSSVIAVQEIPRHDSDKYGVVAVDHLQDRVGRLHGVVEKPKSADAPSNLAIVGRYILTPDIFNLLEQTKPGSGGEIQLTDAIAALLKKERVDACLFQGKRYDCGSKIGYLEATMSYALKHQDLAEDFKKLLLSYTQ